MECRVVEVFRSLQGEGPEAGTPAVFVRLAGCNLRCPWCDTKYAWSGGEVVEAREVAERVARLAHGAELLVLTGGEPLLQPRCIAKLLEELGLMRVYLRPALETNGTLPPGPLAFMLDHAVVSPKLSNSRYGGTGRPEAARVHPDWLTLYRRGYPRIYWKFVVRDESDVEEVEAFVERHGVERRDVWLMPLASNRDEYMVVAARVARLALEKGFRFSPRLHLELGLA